uniref:Uncharacterized protein n=1 Tax=Timema poppense TaxID=170557 RepID=A0A7R9H0N9_TIMPO|nr:unnamed protein product [Timema poppensis]
MSEEENEQVLLPLKKSSMKVMVKNQKGISLTLDVMPDETFEDLQIRTLQTTGVKINTKQFHLHGLTFDPHSNVIDYFKKYCKAKQENKFLGVTDTNLSSLSLSQRQNSGNIANIAAINNQLISEKNTSNNATVPRYRFNKNISTTECHYGSCTVDKEIVHADHFTRAEEIDSLTVNNNTFLEQKLPCFGETLSQPDEYSTVTKSESQCAGSNFLEKEVFESTLKQEVIPQSLENHVESKLCSSNMNCNIDVLVNLSDSSNLEQPNILLGESIDQPVEDEIKSDHDIESDSSSEEDMDQILADDDVEDEDEDEVEAELHPGKLCRLCAKENMHMIFIYSKNGIELGLKQRINIWLRTCVSKHDYLPKQVCGICIEKLQACEDFAMLCYQSERLLEKLVKKHKFRSKKCAIEGAERSSNVTGDELTKSTSTQLRSQIVTQEINEQSQETNSVLVPHIAESSIPPQINVDEDYSHVNSSLLDRVSVDTNMDSENSSGNVSKTYCCPLCVQGNMLTKTSNGYNGGDSSSNESGMSEHTYLPNTFLKSFDDSSSQTASDEDDFEISSADGSYYNSATPAETNFSIVSSDKSVSMVANLDSCTDPVSDDDSKMDDNPQSLCVAELAECGSIPKCRVRDHGLGGSGDAKLGPVKKNDSRTRSLTCHLCLIFLTDVTDAFLHTLLFHCEKLDEFLCSLCDERFNGGTELTNHFFADHDCKVTGYEYSGNEIRLIFYCYECLQQFSTETALNKHKCSNKSYFVGKTCKICDITFKYKNQLKFHMQSHMEGFDILSCKLCNITFTDETVAYDHSRFSHRGALIICSICGSHFNGRGAFNVHQRLHQNTRKFKCEVCSKSFFDKQTLKEHSVVHMDTKPFQCHICGKYLAKAYRLKKHLEVHKFRKVDPQEVYKCSSCHEVFPSQDKAAHHLQVDHADQNEDALVFDMEAVIRVLRCEYCDRCFSSSSVLNSHRATHTEDLVFRCNICTTAFATFSRLATHKLCHAEFSNTWSLSYHRKSHLKTGHCVEKKRIPDENKAFECNLCKKRFITEHGLYMHIRSRHPSDTQTSYQCDECGKVFSREISLELHKKVHEGCKEYSCTLCERSFVHKSSLITHLKIHKGIYPHACKYCDKRFRQLGECDDHQRKHTGERPFVCEVCSKAFRTRSMWFEHCRLVQIETLLFGAITSLRWINRSLKLLSQWVCSNLCCVVTQIKTEHHPHLFNKIHKDERPFPCEICGASFRRSFALKSHMTIHTKVRAFVCDICNKDFRLKQDLQKHTISAHLKKTT